MTRYSRCLFLPTIFLKFFFFFFFLSALSLCCSEQASLVVLRGLSCPTVCGILVPWPGVEPESPAWEGGFLTTGPPEKSWEFLTFLDFQWDHWFFFFLSLKKKRKLVDLQYCVHFRYKALWLLHTHTHTHTHIYSTDCLPLTVITEYGAETILWYTVGPYWLSVLYIVACIC